MAERILYPEWRKQNESTKYPFSERATLINSGGRLVIEGTLLDAILYPIGGGEGLHLTKVTIDHQQVTVYVGDDRNEELCSGSFPLVNPDGEVSLTDEFGRPAGLLVSEGRRLGIFQSWGVGEHTFTREQTEFSATVCVPTPEIGVRGVRLETGEVFVGDVWLVGDDGVVFRTENHAEPAKCAVPIRNLKVIRMDVVGDPLFRRRLCTPNELFETPQFIKTIRVVGPNGEFTCTPDNVGDLKLWANNALAADTVLRVVSTDEGIAIGATGDVTQN